MEQSAIWPGALDAADGPALRSPSCPTCALIRSKARNRGVQLRKTVRGAPICLGSGRGDSGPVLDNVPRVSSSSEARATDRAMEGLMKSDEQTTSSEFLEKWFRTGLRRLNDDLDSFSP